MFDTVLFLVLSVIFSGTLSEMFLNFLDEKYGVSTFVWYFITYLFFMLPVGIYKYASESSKCKKNIFFTNMIQAIKSAAITVGIVDILSIVIGFVPVVGNIISVIEYIPLIGTPAVWLICYFLYYGVTKFFTLFTKEVHCTDIGLTAPLIFSGISLSKPFIYDFLP